jgi:hypothetical protein
MSLDILSEAEQIKGFLQSLFAHEPPQEKESKLEKKAKDIVESILKQLKLKYHSERTKGKDGIVLRHFVTIDQEQYVLKSYLILDAEHFSCVLWSKDESDYMQVVTVGYLKDFHAMIAVGRQRLKSWMEKNNHGISRSE